MMNASVKTYLTIESDEHILGPLGRMHTFSGYRRLETSLESLTSDTNNLSPSIISRPGYQDILDSLGLETKVGWERHTLLSYYKPFLPHDESTVSATPYRVNTFRNTTHWRWCKHCTEEDMNSAGVPYFHVQHQLPGMMHCHKHGEMLISHCNWCGKGWRDLANILTPPILGCPNCKKLISAPQHYECEVTSWLEDMALGLFNQTVNPIPLKSLQEKYKDWIGTGHIGHSFTLPQKSLMREAQYFIDHAYDAELFKAIFNKTRSTGRSLHTHSYLIYDVAYKPELLISPIIHALISRAIWGELPVKPKLIEQPLDEFG